MVYWKSQGKISSCPFYIDRQSPETCFKAKEVKRVPKEAGSLALLMFSVVRAKSGSGSRPQQAFLGGKARPLSPAAFLLEFPSRVST